jgi:hypothetical protein
VPDGESELLNEFASVFAGDRCTDYLIASAPNEHTGESFLRSLHHSPIDRFHFLLDQIVFHALFSGDAFR